MYTWSDKGTEQRRLIKKSEKIRTPGLELQRKHVSCNERASVTEIHFYDLFELLGTCCSFKQRRQWVPKFSRGYQESKITSHT